MSDTPTLNVVRRDRVGHANVKLAPQGLVPAVVYGRTVDSFPVSVNLREFEAQLAAHGSTMLVTLNIEGGDSLQALIREIARHPVTRIPQNIDFLAVDADTAVTSVALLSPVGEAVGVRMEDGILNVELHEIAVEALPADLPDRIEYDISEMSIGDVITVGDLPVPGKVTVLTDAESVVASIMAPAVEVEATDDDGDGAEPEVIGAKGDDEGGEE